MTETVVPHSTGDGVPGVPAPGSPEGLPTRLLVLGMTHRDGHLHGAEVYPVAEVCGLTTEQVRSCLRRLVAEGLYERISGEGRDAVFTATPGARVAFGAAQQRHLLGYAQDAAGRGWDRRWRLVAFNIPEGKRAARDALRDFLLSLGGAAIQAGLYVSPHEWFAEVLAEARHLGVEEHVTLATTEDPTIGGITDPLEIVRRLWPLDAIAKRYEQFVETYRDVPARLEDMRRAGERLAERDYLPGALHIAIRFNECFETDPLLPPELLPRPWPGREARELLVRCRRMGMLTRADRSGPALFEVFDEGVAALP